jgi:hypothetical protein
LTTRKKNTKKRLPTATPDKPLRALMKLEAMACAGDREAARQGIKECARLMSEVLSWPESQQRDQRDPEQPTVTVLPARIARLVHALIDTQRSFREYVALSKEKAPKMSHKTDDLLDYIVEREAHGIGYCTTTAWKMYCPDVKNEKEAFDRIRRERYRYKKVIERRLKVRKSTKLYVTS